MPSPKTQPARGMRDFLPGDVRKREYVIGRIKQVYERYGFEPLETPAVENIETLMGKYGEEGNQLIFKILKRGEHEKTGEADLALRYDLTVPLARVMAQYQNELPKFFKRYQIQPVWRADRPARGRFREFYQCDVDVLGSRSMVVEAELIAAASDALVALGFNDFTIRVNHRQVLTGILDQAGVEAAKHGDALVALDKMDKVGPEGVARELRDRGIVDESAVKLMRFFEGLAGAQHALDLVDLGDPANARAAYNADVLGRLVEFIGAHEIGASGVDDLRQILQFSKASGVDARIKLDPTLARGLAYYTGAIIEINVADLSGSLGGGGRYDNLVGMFLGKDVPACGFSLGLERIIVVMSEREMFQQISSPAEIMVTVWNEASLDESLALARELRDKKLKVDVYPEADKLGKQVKYASERGISFVAILGDEERSRGEVAIKNMWSGEQWSVKRDTVAEALRKAFGQPVGEADDSIKPGA